jgi:hypothetical protein
MLMGKSADAFAPIVERAALGVKPFRRAGEQDALAPGSAADDLAGKHEGAFAIEIKPARAVGDGRPR